MGSRLEPDVRCEARNEIQHQYLSAAKARQMLAWNPHYTLAGALAETIAWYRNYFAALAGVREEEHDDGSADIAA